MPDGAIDDGIIWGKTGVQIFKKQQALAGFGAAVAKLKDNNVIAGFSSVLETVKEIDIGENQEDFLIEFNKSMRWISENAKKIGNAQRMYFQYYFRELINPAGDGYCDLYVSIDLALQKYKSQVF